MRNKVTTEPRHEEIRAVDLPQGGIGRIAYSSEPGNVIMRTYAGLVNLADGMTWTYDSKEEEDASSIRVIPVRTATIEAPWLN